MTEDINSSLFSQEDLTEMEASQFMGRQDGPCTVLGLSFASDSDRREYFREELRKRLPELKKIEGYPIASDDDVISLSDPPFYTACPNPWLNDFIREWEIQKKELVSQKKRVIEKNVSQPYAIDVSEGKNNPVYTAHTYHTKVPHPAIMRYILHYTEPGDIVYDGFAGTGMTGVAAQACGNPSRDQRERIEQDFRNYNETAIWGQRHAICGDLSPYASLISYNYNTPTDYRLFKSEVERIFNEVKDEIGWMYQTKVNGKNATIDYVVWSDVCVCQHCGKEFHYWDAAVDEANKKMNDSLVCPHCKAIQEGNPTKAFITKIDRSTGSTYQAIKRVPKIVVCRTIEGKRLEKKAEDFDLELAQRIEEFDSPYWYPTEKMMNIGSGWGDTWRAGVHSGVTMVHQFYTTRNLIALATILDKINSSKLPNKAKFIFTGMINRSTIMNRVHFKNYFFGGGGWNAGHLKGTLYIPSAPVETSILEQVEDKMNGYLRAIPMLPREYDNALYVASAENSSIADESIDYIFVDPPFGANIMYSELNFLPESWLKVVTNNKTEAIENNSQGKDTNSYLSEMEKCFMEFYRILKPQHWMTVEFSNTSAAVWNAIQRAISRAGFVIANVAALDKKQGGMRSITTSTAVRQDLAISCYKPSETLIESFEQNNTIDLWEFIDEHLHHLPVHLAKGKSTEAIVERSAKILFDRLISFFVEKGLPVPIDASDFQRGLRERYEECDGMFFTAIQLNEYLEKKKSAPEFVPMGLIVGNEADGIEWLRIRLRDNPQTYQDIQPDWLQAIGGIRRGDILPGLDELLEENFIQEADGTWRLPNIQDDVDKDKLRTKALLKEFKAYVEAASKPKAKIKEVRVEAIRAGFKQCYIDKDFATIVKVGDKIPQNLLSEDEILLQFYDIALSHV
jgi:DNA modification methylase